MPQDFFIEQKLMENSAPSWTTEPSMIGQFVTPTLYPSSAISSTICKEKPSSQSSTSVGDSTTSVSKKKTAGKQPSKPLSGYTSQPSCTSDLPTPLQLSAEP